VRLVNETWDQKVQASARSISISGRGAADKTVVFDMVERNGGVAKASTISSDEWHAYKNLGKQGYQHGACNHGKEEWVNGIHQHDNEWLVISDELDTATLFSCLCRPRHRPASLAMAAGWGGAVWKGRHFAAGSGFVRESGMKAGAMCHAAPG